MTLPSLVYLQLITVLQRNLPTIEQNSSYINKISALEPAVCTRVTRYCVTSLRSLEKFAKLKPPRKFPANFVLSLYVYYPKRTHSSISTLTLSSLPCPHRWVLPNSALFSTNFKDLGPQIFRKLPNTAP